MSWKDKSNLSRVFNVFKRSKDKVYKEDINALKELETAINDYSKRIAKDNLIYSKLLAIYLIQNSYYLGSAKEAIKALQKELKEPIDYHLQRLTIDLNNLELTAFLKEKDLNPNLWFEKFRELNKEQEESVTEKIKNLWTYETVEKSFYSSANDLLKDLENYT